MNREQWIIIYDGLHSGNEYDIERETTRTRPRLSAKASADEIRKRWKHNTSIGF